MCDTCHRHSQIKRARLQMNKRMVQKELLKNAIFFQNKLTRAFSIFFKNAGIGATNPGPNSGGPRKTRSARPRPGATPAACWGWWLRRRGGCGHRGGAPPRAPRHHEQPPSRGARIRAPSGGQCESHGDRPPAQYHESLRAVRQIRCHGICEASPRTRTRTRTHTHHSHHTRTHTHTHA